MAVIYKLHTFRPTELVILENVAVGSHLIRPYERKLQYTLRRSMGCPPPPPTGLGFPHPNYR